ncbi:hypothetical protein FHL15_011169 [Xylaria flabelliformis]|uniref:Helicase ATP-binding domain-containing protein n=1 Tax=Xylaria flabelliformis TaxID=2512241 RepID=A0A553HJ01_9PEZI|nr:hypothetical protein FHL15_011169 [Xylaria flabelliformis]
MATTPRLALPETFCPGNDRLDQAIANIGCDLPPYYPETFVDDFDFEKCTSNRYLTGPEVSAFEKKWKNLLRRGSVPVRIEMGLFDAESAQAAYLGFQGAEGLNQYVYFVDNPAAEIFGPLRRHLTELESPKRNTLAFMSYVGDVRQPQYDTWVDKVLQDPSDFSVPDSSADDSDRAQYWAILAAVLRGLKMFPRLLVETDDKIPRANRLTPHVRGHSMEDYHRLYVVFRQFMKRRKNNSFKMTAPARNHAQPTLAWYRTPNEIEAEAAAGARSRADTDQDGNGANYEDFGALWSLETEKLRKRLHSATVHSHLQGDAEFERYNALDEDDRDDVAYQNLDAVERIRLQMYEGPDSNVVAQNLPPMTPDEIENLLATLESRIGKLTEGTNCQDLRGRLDDPEFFETLINAIDDANNAEVDNFNEDDDDQALNDSSTLSAELKAAVKARRHKNRSAGLRTPQVTDLLDATPEACEFIKEQRELHQNDFITVMDAAFGGNDSSGMSMDQAKSITGFDWQRPTLVPSDPKSAKMLYHQIPDVAAVVDKLEAFPHCALLSSACGIGKTFEALATILVLNRRNIIRYDRQVEKGIPKKQRLKFYPSLWLCPSTLVRTAYNECVAKFSGLLKPKLYYGHRADFSDSPGASVIESHEELLNDFNRLDPHDPESAKVVYISSYFTFKRRSMKCTSKLRKHLSDQDRVHLGLHIYDSPEKRKHTAGRGTPESDSDSEEDETEDEGIDDEYDDEDPEEKAARMNLERERRNNDDEPIPEDQREEEAEESGKGKGKKKRAEMKYRIFSPAFDQTFNVVVCDEAHILKNKSTASHKTVKVLKRDHLLQLTATPMLNHPRDVLAYLLMMWPECEPTQVPTDFSYRTMYGTGSELNLLDPHKDVRETGYLRRAGDGFAQILHKARNGRQPFNKHHKLLKPFIVDGCAIPEEEASPIIHKSDPFYEPIKRAWEKKKRPVWILNPCNFHWASRELGFQFEACREIILPMLSLYSVKRGLQTVLTLPDGRRTRPADSIPGARFRVVDLQFKKEEQDEYNVVYNEWKKKLFTADGDSGKKKDKPRGKDLHQRPGGDPERAGQINMRAVRRLTMPGFCLDNETLLEPRENMTWMAATHGISREQFESMVALNESSTNRGSGKGRPAAMGTEEVEVLANQTKDGGASWLWTALNKKETRNSPPNSRYQFVRFLCWNSPILCAMIIQIHKWFKETNEHGLPNKVVCMSMMPWVQQDVTLVLQMMGWDVLSIRSEHTVAERDRTIAKFNDQTTGPQILCTSMELSAWGLNLHNACCRGIVVQWPWSVNQLIQILGRLPRIGQIRWVEWVIYNMSGTMYHRMQSIVFSKYVHQLAVESRIPKSLHGVPAAIAGYSLIQTLFNMPHHLYLCDRNVFDLDTCWIDPQGRPPKMAKFFELIGFKFLGEQPNPQNRSEVKAYEALMARETKDFIAGAFLWLAANDVGAPFEMTWEGLDKYCQYGLINGLTEIELSRYIHPQMIEQLKKNKEGNGDFVAGRGRKSGGKRKRQDNDNSPSTRQRRS